MREEGEVKDNTQVSFTKKKRMKEILTGVELT